MAKKPLIAQLAAQYRSSWRRIRRDWRGRRPRQIAPSLTPVMTTEPRRDSDLIVAGVPAQ